MLKKKRLLCPSNFYDIMEWNRGNLAGNNWNRGKETEQFKYRNKQREKIQSKVFYTDLTVPIYTFACAFEMKGPVLHVTSFTLYCVTNRDLRIHA